MASLMAAGCVVSAGDQRVEEKATIAPLQVAEIGEFLLRCLRHEAIQAGIRSGDPEKAK
jgi:hypothetical protein